ncbi:ABC transporter permease [Streptomyces ipomoeae]|uniref:ABC transporter, permease protein n=1 Tax=Streptomyces ipomoeae 91-03 TaxID=698759 RepID=L1L0B4_9ACTN|nr:ABC transporter permease [Streptomyces ipomoeae]EKX66234.1 ABC transporter, permease protein [Streptomyces ipomoeae 91-03]MDX2697637.1 ABC transporter permease [Streptomyces ipomoeae]MDX2825143.1 ABC transporter permease [Streptomyces ipomoeae]MDX2842274.1 ABC transporter permease [Streptomyces ipomoeae]MDX2876703.1 ABC transporter permease [Streptomyces ipomoeae]
MGIAAFVLRRLCAGLLLLSALSFLVFALLAASPGTPIQTLLGTRPATPELVAELRARHHLDDPFAVQYLHWLSDAVHLDLGRSISVQPGTPVADIIYGRMALTAELALYCLLLALLVGVPLGMAAGIRRGRTADRGISLLATVGFGAPVHALSIVLLYVFGVVLGWFPVYGAGEGFADRVTHLTLPAVALATVLSAVVIRQTRAATLTVTRQDYVTFARLRGLSPARVLFRYVLRNSAPPVVTSAGLLLIAPLGSGIFIEQVFSLPGAGSLLLSAVASEDVPVVQGLTLLLGALVIVINLLVDLLTFLLDPRIRLHAEGES